MSDQKVKLLEVKPVVNIKQPLSTPEEIKAEIMRRMSDPDLDARCQRWRLGVPWRPLPKLSDGGKG